MKESKETKKTRNITFRLTDEECAQVEKAAETAGDDPNDWCRKVAIDKLSEQFALSKTEPVVSGDHSTRVPRWARIQTSVGHGRHDGGDVEEIHNPSR